MARFRFELEPVLRQREHIEREKQVVVGAIDRERISLENELRAIQESLEEERSELRRQLGPEGHRFGAVREQAQAIRALHRRAMEIATQLGAVLERLHDARKVLASASADRRAIELLRERRLEQWKRAQLAKEQRELDDVMNGASARRVQEAA